MRSTVHLAASVVAVLAMGSALFGCSHHSEYTPAQQQTLSRFQQIAKESGGDWNKVSAADKQWLINGPGGGSEENARMMLGNFGRSPQKGPPAGPPQQ